jgi:hypothetical protein
MPPGVGYAGAPQTDQDFVKGATLFNYEDADAALDNAMRGMGLNPFIANPFVQSIRRQARPLAQSFLIGKAQDPYAWSGQGAPGSPGDRLDMGSSVYSDYENFLRAQLAGGAGGGFAGSPGGVYGSIRNARQGFPNLLNAVRQNQARMAGGGTVGEINPYATLMGEALGADNGAGAAQLLGQLNAPFMAPSLQTAYRTGLGAAQQGALYNMMQQPSYTGDIWQWMFGR